MGRVEEHKEHPGQLEDSRHLHFTVNAYGGGQEPEWRGKCAPVARPTYLRKHKRGGSRPGGGACFIEERKGGGGEDALFCGGKKKKRNPPGPREKRPPAIRVPD